MPQPTPPDAPGAAGTDSLPDASQIWVAIERYLQIAYAEATVPAAVQQRLEQLRQNPSILQSPCIERDNAASPRRYLLRLGNRFYPHMKLVLDRPADGPWLLRADTHDAHCRPKPGSPEMGRYDELCARNRQLASQIEDAWAELGLSTFKSFLRQDLERRRTRI
jgi:hypothetical protein